jgi:hypothetical protein
MEEVKEPALNPRWRHPVLLMMLMALCLVSRVLCPLQTGAVRSHLNLPRYARPLTTQQVRTGEPLQLAAGHDVRALASSPEDGMMQIADASALVLPLTQPPHAEPAVTQTPPAAAFTCSPLRI